MRADHKHWDWRASLEPPSEGNFVKVHLNIHTHYLTKSHGELVAFSRVDNKTEMSFAKKLKRGGYSSPYKYRKTVLGQMCLSLEEIEELNLERRTRYELVRRKYSQSRFILNFHSNIPAFSPLRLPFPAISVY
jgi:hypothetical protein